MAKKNRQLGRPQDAPRSELKPSAASSRAIPILVGVVVVTIIAGMAVSLGRWRSAPPESVAKPTALPGTTLQMPYPDVARISVETAQEKLSAGEIVMVDVRSKRSYDTSHIEGAISIPENEIERRLDELDRKRGIVLYCT